MIPRPSITAITAIAVAATVAAVLTSCADHEFEPPDREAQVAEADSLFDPVAFDTLVWESRAARELEGNAVYAASCRNCHGVLGAGGTDYAAARGIEVPSLVLPEWELAGDIQALRRRIFIGHPAGMPTWGVAGIPVREIDAAAFYILEGLRPEVLGGDAAGRAPASSGGG